MNAPAPQAPLEKLFGLFAEGEMGEVSATTTRLLCEGATPAPLLRFLNLMSRADQIWDISYDYRRIRGMIWMAQRAIRNVAPEYRDLARGLKQYAQGYMAYTACEGGFVSNDPKRLAHLAAAAQQRMGAAEQTLSALGTRIADAMLEDIAARLPYFDGLRRYAEALDGLLFGDLPAASIAAVLEAIDVNLAAVEAQDGELASELRSHRLFLAAHADQTAAVAPLLANAEVVLGVCAYVDDDLMKQLNEDILHDEQFGEAELSKWLSVSLQDALRTEALQDIFETALGEENMRASVFQPGELVLFHRGKRYTVTPTLKFSNLGIVSMEFSIELEDADEFELQSILDLIAPHAPEVLLLQAADEDLEPPPIRHPFVLLEHLSEIAPDDPLLQEGLAILDAHTDTLTKNLNINQDLEGCLGDLQPIIDRLDARAANNPQLAPICSALTVSRAGAGYFRALCDRWMEGFLAGSHARYGLDRFKVSYARDRDWFSTVKFGSIHEPGGPPLTCPELVDRQRFRWMLCPSREAKASIGDWIRAEDALPRNLATIRSHHTDFLYIRGNQAWFYFPDDPYYLIDYEYTETLRLMMWIRTLVNAFTELAIAYNKRSDDLRRAFLRLGAHPRLQELLSDERRLAEYFKLKADNKLSLLQDCLISRYDDHARLLDAVVTHMDLDRARGLLTGRLDKVIATQAFLDRQVEALSAQAREEREIRQEQLSKQQNRFLKNITTVAAGLYGTTLIPFTEEWQRYALIVTIITPMALLLLRNWLEQRSVKASMDAQDEEFTNKLAHIRSELERGLEWNP